MPVAAERASKQGPSQDGQNKSNDHAAGTTQAPLTGSWVAYLKGLVGGDKKAPNVGDDSAKKTPLSKDPKASTRHGNEVVEPKYADVGKQVYKDGAALGDVNQGYLANCYLVAAMGAIAMQRPDLVESMIKDNGDGTYDVTLYIKNNSWDSKGQAKVVTVDSKFPSADKGLSAKYAKVGDKGAKGPELWCMLIEKAWAVHKGTYTGIEGGHVNDDGKFAGAIALLTNLKEGYYTPSSIGDKQLAQMISDALTKKMPVACDSKITMACHSVRAEHQLGPGFHA